MDIVKNSVAVIFAMILTVCIFETGAMITSWAFSNVAGGNVFLLINQIAGCFLGLAMIIGCWVPGLLLLLVSFDG